MRVTAVLLAPAVTALLVAGGASATAAPTPRPTPTSSAPTTPWLPVLRQRLDPQRSVGGPRLAGMGLVTDLPAGVPKPPTVRELSYVLADMETGEIVAAKAPHAHLRPASAIKTLTADVLIPRLPATRRVTVTDEDARADGTRVGLIPGQRYTVAQLMQGLLMASGNDCAYALARVGGGSQGRAGTVQLMNQRAAYLGAYDTVVRDPSGLDVEGQRSSAYDLALIGRAAMSRKAFRAYVTTREASLPGWPAPTRSAGPSSSKAATTGSSSTSARPRSFKVQNHNRLLYNYPGTIGIKNGYTTKARRTYISAVTRGGRTYLLAEMYGIDVGWRDQAKIYDWAFRYGHRARPVGHLVDPGEVPVAPTGAPRTPSASTAPAPSPTTPTPPDGATTTQAAATGGDTVSLTTPVPRTTAAAVAGVLALLAAGAGAIALRRERRRH